MAPVDGTPKTLTPDFAFKLVSEGKANDLVDVKKYRSSRTGLTVVIADVDGPVVNGYFCLGKYFSLYFVLVCAIAIMR